MLVDKGLALADMRDADNAMPHVQICLLFVSGKRHTPAASVATASNTVIVDQ
jgi:hypothetical protein